jgi:hypothetical protein
MHSTNYTRTHFILQLNQRRNTWRTFFHPWLHIVWFPGCFCASRSAHAIAYICVCHLLLSNAIQLQRRCVIRRSQLNRPRRSQSRYVNSLFSTASEQTNERAASERVGHPLSRLLRLPVSWLTGAENKIVRNSSINCIIGVPVADAAAVRKSMRAKSAPTHTKAALAFA